jgi:hypothetical protein
VDVGLQCNAIFMGMGRYYDRTRSEFKELYNIIVLTDGKKLKLIVCVENIKL